MVIFLVKRFFNLRLHQHSFVHLVPVFLHSAPLVDISALIKWVVTLLVANKVLNLVSLVCYRLLYSMGHLQRVHDWHVTHLIFISQHN